MNPSEVANIECNITPLCGKEEIRVVMVAYLNDLIPTTRNNHRVHQVGAESDTRNPGTTATMNKSIQAERKFITNPPLGVPILLDIEFTFTKGVPELDCFITRTRDDLPIISAEADGQNVRSVSDEFPGRISVAQVPKTESVIPRSGKGELAVGRDDDVGNEVVVSVENALWVTERVLVSGQLPDDDGFVYRGRGQIPRRFLEILD